MPLRYITVQVRAGEILGIAVLSREQRQDELLSARAGELLTAVAMVGSTDRTWARMGPISAAGHGPGKLTAPEERWAMPPPRDMSLDENAMLDRSRARKPCSRRGMLKRPAATFAERIIARFDVRTLAPQSARSLSGGTFRKFVTARGVATNRQVAGVNQPTWGVDASAAARSGKRCWIWPKTARRDRDQSGSWTTDGDIGNACRPERGAACQSHVRHRG